MAAPDINEILARPENNACSRYGADMGRRNQVEGQAERLYLQQLRFIDGDYDTGGAYWGESPHHGPIWCAFSPEATENEIPIRVFVRARNRESAKAQVLACLEGDGWTFFR